MSRWAQRRIVREPGGPGSRASTLPASDSISAPVPSSVGWSPIWRSSSATASATARSRPDGLSISQSRTKSRTTRSFSARLARGAVATVKR